MEVLSGIGGVLDLLHLRRSVVNLNTAKGGYNEEKWHWSYLPLSKKYIDQVKLRMKDKLVKGFEGAEVAKEIGVVEKYILGINHECL